MFFFFLALVGKSFVKFSLVMLALCCVREAGFSFFLFFFAILMAVLTLMFW